jgi:HEAT repeat protein
MFLKWKTESNLLWKLQLQELIKAREDGDIQAEVAATKDISRLGYEEARLSEIKVRNAKPVETEINNLLQLLKKHHSQSIQIQKLKHGQEKTLGLDKMKL